MNPRDLKYLISGAGTRDFGNTSLEASRCVKPVIVSIATTAPQGRESKAVGMGTAYSAPQLNEPDVPGQSLPDLPSPQNYNYHAKSFEELADMMCTG